MKRIILPLFVLFVSISFFVVSYSCSNNTDVNTTESKVEELLSRMTLEEKIGQMIQVDYNALKHNLEDITKYNIGSILWGGDSEPDDLTPTAWANLSDNLQSYSQKTRLKIPIIFGIDAVHGNNNVDSSVIFPHNIGLGAAADPELVERIARITAIEMRGTGIHWNFAPCVAVARNEKWGRTYESFSEDTELVRLLGTAYLNGLQAENFKGNSSALACVKHFIGDGGTTDGKDQGNTECSEEELRKIHLPPYIDAIKNNALTVMASYNSWNGEKLHGHKYLLTDVLKKELGFKGFIISDWAGIDQLQGNYKDNVEHTINAGMDMVMIPNGSSRKNNYVEFFNYLNELVEEGKVSIERINDAVRRILLVKFEVGLFENHEIDRNLIKKIGSTEHRSVAREAVKKSLVLLKNENKALPLSKDLKRIYVTGKGANDLGMQCGGWTITWQGGSYDVISGGTNLLQAIRNTVDKNTEVIYSEDGSKIPSGALVITVIGEKPYAEGMGDREYLNLSQEDISLIKRLKRQNASIITILFSGRPMIINEAIDLSDAFVAAWLPGTEGEGITDVIFGDYNPTGKLSFTWPRSMDQIPINIGDENYNPLFSYGFGLNYK